MQVRAKLNYLRIAPRKVRLVADLIRGKKADEAQTILNFAVKKAAKPLLKLLNSALANARNNFQLNPDALYISKITVDEGPKYKRWMPRARGRASEIQKKTSHITIFLKEIKEIKEGRKTAERAKKKFSVIQAKTLKGKREVSKSEASKTKISEPEVDRALKRTPPVPPKPKPELEKPKPKIVRGIKRIFRRKAF